MIRRNLYILALTFAALFISIPLAFSSPENALVLKEFAKLPIMHEGRIKPMDSFARALSKTLSGSEKNALPWLAESLFNPARAENTPIIKISNPDLINMLDLTRRKNKKYAYKDLSHALASKQDILASILKTPDENWTDAQRDFVLLQKNVVLLGDLLSSLSLFLPLSVQLPDTVPETLRAFSNTPLTYMDILKFREALQKETLSIAQNKNQNIEDYSDVEKAITLLSFTFDNLQRSGRRSMVLTVIPTPNAKAWQAPWQIISGQGQPESVPLFEAWQSLSAAYHTNDSRIWAASIERIHALTKTAADKAIRHSALNAEYIYNQLSPFVLTVALYAACLVLLIMNIFWKNPQVLFVTAAALGSAVLIHAASIITRMFILERAPVSTLYESVIFVGLVVSLYGLIAFLKNREVTWLYLGAGCGLFLTLVSFTHDQDGDSMLMITAVLNTNFWLATHVICITVGYAFCVITSFLAHLMLFKPSKHFLRHMHSMALTALLFSTIGTILGGIWADQSWGRFWGWDPKENGALLIVLWLVWILHGRISGQMKDLFFSAGLAYLSVIVALSWFGVNLLNVGLHAYGFTDSAAVGLGIFVAVETILIIGLVYRNRMYQRKMRAHAH